jgi:hypothetical protein
MTKHYLKPMPSPFSATSVLANLSAATEVFLTARDARTKLDAWKNLEDKLADARELLSLVGA